MTTINTKISKHANDLIQKYATSLFRNATLEFYGIKSAPIKELINPELPEIKVTGGAADIVFLLEDDTYLHFAFETGHNSKGAMLKCIGYDTRLYERDGRLVHTVIIYTADVKTKPQGLSLGTLSYNPQVILMANYDGDTIFKELEAKIRDNEELKEIDTLNLMLLPLMNHTIPRQELAENTIRLAQTISNPALQEACVAAAIGFASKFFNEADLQKLKGVAKMADLVMMVVNDELIKIAKNMIRNNESTDKIVEYLELDEATVKKLQEELGCV